MYIIQRGINDVGCYSEWMRTKNGELAVVSVKARETENASLYAYAYAHAVLTFFRLYDTENASRMKKNAFAETILDHLKYASQKLDVTFGVEEKHPLPFVSGYFTINDDKIVCFVIGDSAVRFRCGKRTAELTQSLFSRSKMKKHSISGKKLPLDAVRLATADGAECVKLYPLREDAKSAEGGAIAIEKTEAGETRDTRVFRAVVTGRRHASKGQYCQDYARYVIDDEYLGASLSDGAGGGSCSEYGAIMNVNAFLSCCEDDIPQGQFKELLLDRIEQTHERLTEGKQADAIQAYATMMGVYVRGERLLCLHIGDGMIYGRRRDGSVECISDAENYYVSNRTFFTIEPDADEHLYMKVLHAGDYDRILMMTDGVYNGYPASEGERGRAEYIREVFRESDRGDFDDVSLARLIDTEQVLRYGDDHSAIMICLDRKDH